MSALDRIHAQEGDTLDCLLWRERGLGPEIVTHVLDLNPGLARIGAILPIGTPVMVPPPPSSDTPLLPLIQLWS